MAVCKAPESKIALQESLKRAQELSKTMKVTKDGEVLSETIRIAEEGLAMIKAKDFDSIPALDRSALVANVAAITLRQHLSDTFDGAIGPNTNSRSKRSTMVLKGAEFTDGGIKVVVSPQGEERDWEFTFQPESDYSDRIPTTGNRLYIPGFADTHRATMRVKKESEALVKQPEVSKAAKESRTKIKSKLQNESFDEILTSSHEDVEKAFDYENASTIKDYVHGSKDDMKRVLADLVASEGKALDNEIYGHYNGLLDKMYPKFFRDMNVYINENQDHAFGWVNLDKESMVINTSSRIESFMSNAEVYMHETIHSLTMWGLRAGTAESRRLQTRLDYLRDTAVKKVKWQDLKKADPSLTEDQARKVHDYVFSSKNSDDEFLAYAMTNPALIKALSEIKLTDEREAGLFAALKDFFVDVFNAFMGNYDFTNRNAPIAVEVQTLAFRLAEINAKAEEGIKGGNFFDSIGALVDTIEGAFEEWVNSWPDKLKLDMTGKMPNLSTMGKPQKALFLAKFFVKALYNKNYRHVAGSFFTFWYVAPDNSLRELGRNFIPALDYDYTPEKHNMRTNSLDQFRNSHTAIAGASILGGFKIVPTEIEEVALTKGLIDANGSALFQAKMNEGKGYSDNQVQRLFKDNSYRKKVIAKRENAIKKGNKKRGNWLVGQAKGLGKFMVTGQGHLNQNQNTRGMVLGYNSNERFDFDKTLHTQLEELAALHAIDKQNQTAMIRVGKMLKSENNGVMNIINLYQSFKEQSEIEFEDNAAHTIEGYSKELFDSTIDVAIEPIAIQQEMEKKGFKLIKNIETDGLEDAQAMGYYVSSSNHQGERLKGAVSLGNPSHRGMSLKDLRFKQFPDRTKHAMAWFSNDKVRLDKQALVIHDRLTAGEDADNIEIGRIPILNTTGRVIDYRANMSKPDKERYLGQDKMITSVLAKTSASLIDKVERDKQNARVLETIKENIRTVHDNTSSEDNLTEYTMISPDSLDPKIQELFYMLPKTYQDFANNREDKSLPIPSTLVSTYFGYRHLRFTDIPGIKQLPTAMKHVINMFEKYYLDLVKIAKSNILMKMPAILVGNIVSNMIYAVNTGMPVKEIVGAYRDSLRDVKLFMKHQKELEEKTIELGAIRQSYSTRRFKDDAERDDFNEKAIILKRAIERLQVQQSKNPVKELFALGMYQSVIEDVSMNKLGEPNAISDGMDKLLSKTPTIIKTPLQWAYLSKETAWYKVSQEVLQLSDLVARDVMNRKQKILEEMQADGKKPLPLEYRKMLGKGYEEGKKLTGEARDKFMRIAENSRHNTLLRVFINYTKPNGRGEEFLNRNGILMFTKYLKGIQQVALESSIKHVIRTSAVIIGAVFLLDMPNIQEQALLFKVMDDNEFGIFGVLPYYSPLEHLFNVVTPALVKPEVYGG